jgi:hypothetical protein
MKRSTKRPLNLETVTLCKLDDSDLQRAAGAVIILSRIALNCTNGTLYCTIH